MPQGTVKWFDGGKGYGFISPEEGGGDLFVHFSAVLGAETKSLEEGEKVSYEVVQGKRGPQAESVRRLSPPPAPARAQPRSAPSSQKPDVPDLLRMLATLRDAGVLTPAEFRAKRDELVEKL